MMVRWPTLLAIVSSSLWGQVAPVGNAPPSPFDVAQLIDSGSRVDRTQLWKDIGAPGAPPADLPLPHCGDPDYSPCSTELIGVANPSQFILLIQEDIDFRGDLFLRFLKDGAGWKFAAYHFEPLKYYPSRHGIMRLGDKPFLKVSRQGISGTGVASEIEEWFDLTLASFDPVFSFTVQGHSFVLPSDVGRDVRGVALRDRQAATETIDLSLTVRFLLESDDLGVVDFTGIYERQAGQEKFVLRRAGIGDYSGQMTPVDTKDFEDLTDMESESGELLLRYDQSGLKTIAAGKDTALKAKLREWSDRLGDSPERNAIKKLLGNGK